ncbi:MAG: hypothetical protein JNL57_05780 [Bacteroidetes bacterium]|nr:hypothetical protein [Bacteroidota bacterium]
MAAAWVVFAAGSTFLLMWVWNGLLAGNTGLHAITFWQSAGLLLLLRMLTGWLGRRRHMGWYYKMQTEPSYVIASENIESSRKARYYTCGGWKRPDDR